MFSSDFYQSGWKMTSDRQQYCVHIQNLLKQLIPTLFCILPLVLFSQNIDFDQFVSDTQKTFKAEDNEIIVWWMPTEFWIIASQDDPDPDKDEIIQSLQNLLNPYSIFIVSDSKTGIFGGITSTSAEHIKENIRLNLVNKMLSPLPEKKISPDVRNLFAILQPMYSMMLGQYGEGLKFIVFDGMDARGNRYLDPKSHSSFSVIYKHHTYDWKLPLVSFFTSKNR